MLFAGNIFAADRFNPSSEILVFLISNLSANIIYKVIILSVSNQVSIFDPELVNINDLGANFYLSVDDIKRKEGVNLV